MNLTILLPFGVFARVKDVACIVAETREGSFGLLPHRLDCAAALAPGILTYAADQGPVYLAADEGVLIKQGAEVVVSVGHCIRGTELKTLHDAVTHQFLEQNSQDRAMRLALTKLEGSLVGRFVESHRG